MNSLLKIPLAYKLGALALLLLAAVGYHLYAVDDARTSGFNAAVDQRKNKDNAELVKAGDESRAKEAKLQAVIAAGVLERSQLKAQNETYQTELAARFRAGTERLRCPGTVVRRQAPASNPTAASGPTPEQGTDVVPETAIDILGIAGSNAKDVRDYNAVVQLYNLMAATCNGR